MDVGLHLWADRGRRNLQAATRRLWRITRQRQLSAGSPISTALADPEARRAIALSGFAAAVAGGLWLSTSRHFLHPVAYGGQLVVTVAGTVAAGLVWLKRRPANTMAPLLLGLAFTTALVALQGSGGALVHSLGVAVEPSVFVLGYVVVFAFPDGTLRGRAERLIVAGFVLYFVLEFTPWLFFSPVVVGSQPLAGCNQACPANGLMIADRPSLAAPFGVATAWAAILLATATIALLVYRVVTASRPRRRALLPVYIPALMLTVPVLVYRGVAAGVADFSPRTLRDISWSITFGRTFLAYGFILAVVQASFFAGSSLKRLMALIAGNPDAADLRAILADALDDPSVELAFRIDGSDGSDAFVNSRGQAVVAVTSDDGRAMTPIERQGDTVAVIWHDAALNTDPELVRAASQAILLALENGRLERRIGTTMSELAESRARAVAAGDLERHRVERDLHDGAQQQLVALRVKVALAREMVRQNPEVAARLDDVGQGLEEALCELRDLSQGIHPPVLREFGLRPALAAAIKRSPVAATLVTDRIVRYPADVEAAVYFCCLEGLQNAGKHAGVDAHTEVRLCGRHDELGFAIVDDGVGCDVESARRSGTGFASLHERVASLGGTLTIGSAPGRGTQLRGRIR